MSELCADEVAAGGFDAVDGVSLGCVGGKGGWKRLIDWVID